MQTVIQVICSHGGSLRESIVKDRKLERYSLNVIKQKTVGRNPGWAKLYSKQSVGVINLIWHSASKILVARVITRGDNNPDELIGQFIKYLLARYTNRIKVINILPE